MKVNICKMQKSSALKSVISFGNFESKLDNLMKVMVLKTFLNVSIKEKTKKILLINAHLKIGINFKFK